MHSVDLSVIDLLPSACVIYLLTLLFCIITRPSF